MLYVFDDDPAIAVVQAVDTAMCLSQDLPASASPRLAGQRSLAVEVDRLSLNAVVICVAMALTALRSAAARRAVGLTATEVAAAVDGLDVSEPDWFIVAEAKRLLRRESETAEANLGHDKLLMIHLVEAGRSEEYAKLQRQRQQRKEQSKAARGYVEATLAQLEFDWEDKQQSFFEWWHILACRLVGCENTCFPNNQLTPIGPTNRLTIEKCGAIHSLHKQFFEDCDEQEAIPSGKILDDLFASWDRHITQWAAEAADQPKSVEAIWAAGEREVARLNARIGLALVLESISALLHADLFADWSQHMAVRSVPVWMRAAMRQARRSLSKRLVPLTSRSPAGRIVVDWSNCDSPPFGCFVARVDADGPTVSGGCSSAQPASDSVPQTGWSSLVETFGMQSWIQRLIQGVLKQRCLEQALIVAEIDKERAQLPICFHEPNRSCNYCNRSADLTREQRLAAQVFQSHVTMLCGVCQVDDTVRGFIVSRERAVQVAVSSLDHDWLQGLVVHKAAMDSTRTVLQGLPEFAQLDKQVGARVKRVPTRGSVRMRQWQAMAKTAASLVRSWLAVQSSICGDPADQMPSSRAMLKSMDRAEKKRVMSWIQRTFSVLASTLNGFTHNPAANAILPIVCSQCRKLENWAHSFCISNVLVSRTIVQAARDVELAIKCAGDAAIQHRAIEAADGCDATFSMLTVSNEVSSAWLLDHQGEEFKFELVAQVAKVVSNPATHAAFPGAAGADHVTTAGYTNEHFDANGASRSGRTFVVNGERCLNSGGDPFIIKDEDSEQATAGDVEACGGRLSPVLHKHAEKRPPSDEWWSTDDERFNGMDENGYKKGDKEYIGSDRSSTSSDGEAPPQMAQFAAVGVESPEPSPNDNAAQFQGMESPTSSTLLLESDTPDEAPTQVAGVASGEASAVVADTADAEERAAMRWYGGLSNAAIGANVAPAAGVETNLDTNASMADNDDVPGNDTSDGHDQESFSDINDTDDDGDDAMPPLLDENSEEDDGIDHDANMPDLVSDSEDVPIPAALPHYNMFNLNYAMVGNKKNGGMFESPTSSTGKVPPTTPRSYQKFRAPPSVVRGTPWPENSPAQEGDETETDGDSGEVVSALSQNASRLAAAREHNASLLVAATVERSDVERLAAAKEHNARLPQQPQTQEEAWRALARDVHLAQKRAGPTGPRTAEEVADLKERKRLWLEEKAPKRSSSGSSTGGETDTSSLDSVLQGARKKNRTALTVKFACIDVTHDYFISVFNHIPISLGCVAADPQLSVYVIGAKIQLHHGPTPCPATVTACSFPALPLRFTTTADAGCNVAKQMSLTQVFHAMRTASLILRVNEVEGATPSASLAHARWNGQQSDVVAFPLVWSLVPSQYAKAKKHVDRILDLEHNIHWSHRRGMVIPQIYKVLYVRAVGIPLGQSSYRRVPQGSPQATGQVGGSAAFPHGNDGHQAIRN